MVLGGEAQTVAFSARLHEVVGEAYLARKKDRRLWRMSQLWLCRLRIDRQSRLLGKPPSSPGLVLMMHALSSFPVYISLQVSRRMMEDV